MIPLAEEINKKSAICVQNGKDAHYTFRLSDDNSTVVIGGLDKYTPMDRITFFENYHEDKILNYNKKNFRKFAEIYCSENKLDVNYDELINFFMSEYKTEKSYVQIIKNFFTI